MRAALGSTRLDGDGDGDASEIERFFQHDATPVPLSRLEGIYNARDVRAAIPYVTHRTRVVLDDGTVLSADHDDIYLHMPRHSIDFECRMSKTIGFDCILPTDADPNRELEMEFKFGPKQRLQRWTTTKGMLGFDFSERMLYIGDAEHAKVWIALAPQAIVEAGWKEVHSSDVRGSSVMSEARYRAVMVFLAHCMHAESIQNVHLRGSRFPPLGDAAALNSVTNILCVQFFMRFSLL